MKTVTFYAWAIDTGSEEGHNLLGRYYFGVPIPPHMEGCMEGCWVALFKTRKEARIEVAKAKEGYNPWAKIRPVKVKVTIEEATNEQRTNT
jgi:hypothetical protein